MKNNVREANWIDALKGLGIILVFLGHIGETGSSFRLYLYTFHVPLFFVLAGYIYDAEKYNQIPLEQQIRQKAKQYLLPYIIMVGINIIIAILIQLLNQGPEGLLIQIARWICGSLYVLSKSMPNCATLWFLPCFFASYVFFAIWHRITCMFCRTLYIVIAFGSTYILLNSVDTQLPFYMQIVPCGITFMAMGTSLRVLLAKVDRAFTAHKYKAVLSIVVALILMRISMYLTDINDICVSLNELEIGEPLVFYLGAFSGAASLMIVFKYVNLKSRVLTLWGQNTLIGMGFNLLMMEVAYAVCFLLGQVTWYFVFIIIMVEYTLICLGKRYILRKVNL